MLLSVVSSLLIAASNGGTAPPATPQPCLWKRSFSSTTYGPPWGGMEGGSFTATGKRLSAGKHYVAVDPRVIKLGSKLTLSRSPLGNNLTWIAEDTGGSINGRTIDIFTAQGRKARDSWGNRRVTVCLKTKGRYHN